MVELVALVSPVVAANRALVVWTHRRVAQQEKEEEEEEEVEEEREGVRTDELRVRTGEAE